MEKLAPDDKSVKAARGLIKPGPWSDLGATDTLVWGKCQGSGKNPYQVSVDLTGPAFKCTCPSRKFPCKHGLALLIMWAESDGVVADMASPAGFASDWAGSRAARAARKESAEAPDPEARAKRLEQRLEKMDAGIADFELWLLDLVRQGLAGVRSQPPEFWERTAGRLVDAQLPGLADRVRRAAHVVAAADDWLEFLLGELSRWYLAARGWKNRAQLSDALNGDLRAYLGWARTGAEVEEAGMRLAGPWTVLGVSQDDTGRILAQRTWLRSAEGTNAVILDFAAAGAALGVARVVGSVIDTQVIAYSGAEPARVMLVDGSHVTAAATALPASPISDNLDRLAGWVAANPFAGPLPAALSSVVPEITNDSFSLVDPAGDRLHVVQAFSPWDLAIHCAQGPVDVFGEWESGVFRPLSVVADGTLVPL